MAEEYILRRDIVHEHRERMENLKKYYPYFRLMENDFSQYQGGKYQQLDMGYLFMAVMRFFLEENNFKEKDVTYEEYSSFIKDIYERDFGLALTQAEEQSLSSYIFDKIRNEGKPYLYHYYDPEEQKDKVARLRVIDSRIKDETVYYFLTAEAMEFYLETKEVRDESSINVSQILLSKMISARNFKGGIEVVRRINSQVAKLKRQREEVLRLLANDVFAGVKAYEEFMEHGVCWFAEEQKYFGKNMELIGEALRRADSGAAYQRTVKDITYLEQELKRALVNHSELLKDCTALQNQVDEAVSKAKFSKLRKKYDFRAMGETIIKRNDASLLEAFILPLLKMRSQKQFALASVDKLLTLPMEKGEKGETITDRKEEQDYISDDEREENRIRENYRIYVRLLLYYISVKKDFYLKEFHEYLGKILGEEVWNNGDYYSMLAHLAQKSDYSMERVLEKPDTFFEEYLGMVVRENPQYRSLKFEVIYRDEIMEIMGKYQVSNLEIKGCE